MDPLVIGLVLATLVCGIGMGFSFARIRNDNIIENTIMYLIHSGYVKAQKDQNDEWELLPIKK